FEENPAGKYDKVDWCNRFLRTLQSRFGGYKPLLYISYSAAKSLDWSRVVQGDFGLWLALWDYNGQNPAPATQWPVVAMRQYTDKGRVAGIAGDVDMNVFYGSLETLLRYGYNPPAPPAPQPDNLFYVKDSLGKELKSFTAKKDAFDFWIQEKSRQVVYNGQSLNP